MPNKEAGSVEGEKGKRAWTFNEESRSKMKFGGLEKYKKGLIRTQNPQKGFRNEAPGKKGSTG